MIWRRLKFLLDGKAVWVDVATCDREITPESWRTRWAISGVHSWNWRWVRRWGKQSCGCTINPATRRVLLIDMECPAHCHLGQTQPGTTA